MKEGKGTTQVVFYVAGIKRIEDKTGYKRGNRVSCVVPSFSPSASIVGGYLYPLTTSYPRITISRIIGERVITSRFEVGGFSSLKWKIEEHHRGGKRHCITGGKQNRRRSRESSGLPAAAGVCVCVPSQWSFGSNAHPRTHTHCRYDTITENTRYSSTTLQHYTFWRHLGSITTP